MDTREGESLPLERNREAAPFGDLGLSWGFLRKDQRQTPDRRWDMAKPERPSAQGRSRAEAETLLSYAQLRTNPRRHPPPRRLPPEACPASIGWPAISHIERQ